MSEEMLEEVFSIKKEERKEKPYLVYEKEVSRERITLPYFLSHRERVRPEIELLFLEYLGRAMRKPSPTIEELEEKIAGINQRVEKLEDFMRKLERQAQYGGLSPDYIKKIARAEIEQENIERLRTACVLSFSIAALLFILAYPLWWLSAQILSAPLASLLGIMSVSFGILSSIIGFLDIRNLKVMRQRK